MAQGLVYNIQRMSTQDGPGLRTTVFLKGCPLRCLWCSNPESQAFTPQLLVFDNVCSACGRCMTTCPYGAVVRHKTTFNRDETLCRNCGQCAQVCPSKARTLSGTEMTVDDVMRVVERDSMFYSDSGGGVTFGGGEPTSAGPFLIELLKAARSQAIHTCVDTCGHCPPASFRKVMELAELFLFDCKHMDPERHHELTGCDNRLVLENLKAVLEARLPVRVRVPLMPNLNDSDENITAMAALLHKYDQTHVDVLPCHAFGRSKYDALRLAPPTVTPYSQEELKTVLARFARHGLDVTLA